MKNNKILFFLLPIMLTSCNGYSLKNEISQDDWNDNRQYIELSTGMKMSYVEMGDPDGEKMILQHGMTDNSRSWSLAAPYFAKAGYHVYIPDLRGQGKSEEMDGHYSTFVYARDLNAFCEAKGIDNAITIGHSLGSYTIQTFWLLYPERVNKCVLVSSLPILGYQTATLEHMYSNIIEPLEENEHLSDAFMDYWYDCSTEPVEEEIKGEVFDTFLTYMKSEAQILSKKSWENIVLGLLDTHFGGCDDEYNLYSIIDKSKECLILHGSTDSMAYGEYQNELVNLLSNEAKTNVKYYEYDGVGHNIQYVIPKRSSTDILNWLKTGTVK